MKFITNRSILLPILVALALCSFGFSCETFKFSFVKHDSPIIARVGKATLTLEDLNNSIPESYTNQITNKQRVNYVKQWIDTELLYQSALRKKIDREPVIKKRLGQMKKDLLSSEMITRLATGVSNFSISEQDIIDYYNINKQQFIRNESVVKYIEIVVENLKLGWKIRNLVTNDNFIELSEKYSIVSVQHPESVQYTKKNQLPEEISDIVFRIRVNGTTSPIKFSDGVHIIKVLDKQDAGKVATISEVKDEILTLLSAKRQREKMEYLLSDIRNRTDYEFNFDIITKNNSTKKLSNTINDSTTNTTKAINEK